MGCGPSKGTQVIAPVKKTPAQEFTNVQLAQQHPLQQARVIGLQPNPEAPPGIQVPRDYRAQQQQSVHRTQNSQKKEGEEYGDEEFDESYEDEASEMNQTMKTRKSAAGNTFRGSIKDNQRQSLPSNYNNSAQSKVQAQQDQPKSILKTNNTDALRNSYQPPVSNSQQQQNPYEVDYEANELVEKNREMRDNILIMKQDLNNELGAVNRFKDSLDQNTYAIKSNQSQQQQQQSPAKKVSGQIPPSERQENDPSSRELNSAIDAYQKQMRDFKNSLSDMNGGGNGNNNNTMTYHQPYMSNMQKMKGTPQQVSEQLHKMGTYNSGMNSSYQNTGDNNGRSVKEEILQRSQQSVQSPIIKPQPTAIIQDSKPINKAQNNVAQQQPTNTDIKKPYASPHQQNKGPLHLKPSLYEDDDEEFRESNYYNFDNGYIKPDGLIGKNYKVEVASSSIRDSIPQKSQDNIYKQEPILSKNQPTLRMSQTHEENKHQDNSNNNPLQYKSVPDDIISMEQLQSLKEQFMEQEERDRLNPQNVLLRILFIHAFTEQNKNEEMALERKLYSFFINKNSNILDLKDKIRKDFGFESDQVQVYFKYKELKNPQYIMDIELFDIEEDILICITINAPKIFLKVILREPLDDIKIADVRFLNSRDRSESGKNELQNFDLDRFNVDLDKLPWPIYRDWTAEAAYLHDIMIQKKQILLSEDSHFALQQGYTEGLHSNPQLAELVEAESAYRKLAEEFRKSSLYAVHLVVKKNPTPLNLFNLYGDEGDKYIVGGIMIRRAKDWMICGDYFNEQAQMTSTVVGGNGESGSSLTEISGKIASLDVRNLALLRNRIDHLVVPLACIVDYYGLKFEAQSIAPLSINSLAYGSDTNGLLFTDHDQNAELIAEKISAMLNLKPHFIEELATGKIKRICLPYTIQLHRNKDLQGDQNLYLVNPFRLFPQDESLRQQKQVPRFQELMSKQLRPELIILNNKNEPATNYQYFTWKNPLRCDECNEWINDYDYYYFEKRSVDKTQKLLVQYYCCQNCYQQLLPTEGFKYPINKIVRKELPMKDRLQYWQDLNTGNRYFEIQYKKVPLNPDAYFDLCNTKDRSEKISEQEEILRTAQKLKDEVLEKLIEDLNNVEEDPLTPQQLEEILHNRGVTMRHLGKICTSAQLNHIREMAVIEVIARSAKLLIKDGLTFLADDEEAGFQSDNIKKCVLHYLQEIFNMDEYQQTSTQNIWDFITEHARKKFQVTVERDVLSKIHLNGLLLSLCKKLNIKLLKPIKDINFYQAQEDSNGQSQQNAFLTIQDFENITPVVKDYLDKPITITIKAESFPSKRSQWFMPGGEERAESTELFRMACSICEQIYTVHSMNYARILKEFAEQLESRHQERGRPENSRWNKSFAIPEDELSMEARYFYQNSLQVLIDIKQDMSVEGAQIYIGLARLFKPRASQFSHYREKENNIQEMYNNLMSAIDIYELILGFDHPETADAYTKMALAYQEQGSFAAASPWMRRAFSIFYKCFGPHDTITLNAYEYLKVIEINIDSKLEQVPYEELPAIIFEVEKQQKIAQQQTIQNMNFGIGRTVPPQILAANNLALSYY